MTVFSRVVLLVLCLLLGALVHEVAAWAGFNDAVSHCLRLGLVRGNYCLGVILGEE